MSTHRPTGNVRPTAPVRTRGSAVAAAAAGVALLGACAAGPAEAEELRADVAYQPLPLSHAPAVAAVIGATEDIGLAMLRSAAAQHEPGAVNTVVSPASLLVALAMLAEGADTTTLAAFDRALGAEGSERTDAVNALIHTLSEFDGDPALVQELADGEDLPEQPLFHLASQVVVHHGFDVHQDYLRVLGESYDAGVQITDLTTEDGVQVLSDWANEHTGGLIPESAIEPDPDLVLVLQNAVLLVAAWEQPFATHATDDRDFTLADGQVVSTETLADLQYARFASAEGWTAVRLPYTQGFAADVLLPPTGTDPAQIEPETLATLTTALGDAAPSMVRIQMPTLDVSTEPLDLRSTLEATGLGELLTQPDLTRIADEDLFVQQAFQQATLQVTEQGTVAAALTELGVALTSAPQAEHELIADRPYLLRIAHTETDLPVFVAAVRDPRHD